MAVAGGHETLVREQDRQSAAQPQEHRRLHVVDVVLRAVDGRRTGHGAGEPCRRVPVQDRPLGMGLEAAVGGHGIRRGRCGLRPRHDPAGLEGHDRRHEDVRADLAVEEAEELLELPAAGRHHEPGHVDDGVPFGPAEGRSHRLGARAVADDAADARRQAGRRPAAVQHAGLVPLPDEEVDHAPTDERAATEDEDLHAPNSIGHFVSQQPRTAISCRHDRRRTPDAHGRVPTPPGRGHLRLGRQRLRPLERRLLLHPRATRPPAPRSSPPSASTPTPTSSTASPASPSTPSSTTCGGRDGCGHATTTSRSDRCASTSSSH